MSVNYIRAKGRGNYRCTGRYNGGIKNRCSRGHTVRAEGAEVRFWKFVREILTNPHRLTQGLEKMLENERQPSTGEDDTFWLRRLAEIDLKQKRLLDLHLDGDITTEQFRVKSAELEEVRAAAEGQLEAARSRLARLEDIERSKDELISHYASLGPQALVQPLEYLPTLPLAQVLRNHQGRILFDVPLDLPPPLLSDQEEGDLIVAYACREGGPGCHCVVSVDGHLVSPPLLTSAI
jgi:hypothetical protein